PPRVGGRAAPPRISAAAHARAGEPAAAGGGLYVHAPRANAQGARRGGGRRPDAANKRLHCARATGQPAACARFRAARIFTAASRSRAAWSVPSWSDSMRLPGLWTPPAPSRAGRPGHEHGLRAASLVAAVLTL